MSRAMNWFKALKKDYGGRSDDVDVYVVYMTGF